MASGRRPVPAKTAQVAAGTIHSCIPSGAGALEFVFVLFFSRFTDSGRALPVILLFRFATWVLPFGIGGGLMAAGRRKEAKDNPI